MVYIIAFRRGNQNHPLFLQIWQIPSMNFSGRCGQKIDRCAPSVKQLFKGKPLPKSSNRTFITLIPKTPTAAEMGDFMPITCVNLMYKLMNTILADRLANVSSELISPN